MVWKPFLDNYLVSDHGRVMNKFTKQILKGGSGGRSNNPYMGVSLSQNGKNKTYVLKKINCHIIC